MGCSVGGFYRAPLLFGLMRKGSMGKLSKYIIKHERPFAVSVPNGKGKLTVMFYDGYVTLRSTQPGVRWGNEIHITYKAWLKLLPQLVRPTRLMEGPSFDRYRAERRHYRELAEFDAAQREEKRQRHRDAQRRRHEAARRRSERA